MYSANKYLVHSNMSCQRQIISECQVGCPIRKSADQSSFAAPHGLSQRITSFIASYRQGIHQTPFSRLIRSSERSTRPSFTDHHLPSVRTRQSRTDMVSALDLERLPSLLAMPNTSNATRSRPNFALRQNRNVLVQPEGRQDNTRKRLVFLSLHNVKLSRSDRKASTYFPIGSCGGWHASRARDDPD